MTVAHNARSIQARELNDTLVGEAFSYESSDGVELHGRIACVEIRTGDVRVTLDGVIVDGSSVVLQLRPDEELWFSPMG
ncbi:hypothetical protein ACLMNJ_22380 [Streptomyces seoulensis]